MLKCNTCFKELNERDKYVRIYIAVNKGIYITICRDCLKQLYESIKS